MQTLTTTETKLERFHAALQQGKESLAEAGTILVDLIDEDPSIKSRILDENPELTENVLETLERIGRKQLYHPLALNDSPGMTALRKCTFSDQKKHFSEPVPVLLIHSRDDTGHLQIPVHSLTAKQARQVFCRGHIRSLGEQRAWLESQRKAPAEAEHQKPYHIGKGKVTFRESVTLNTSQLASILAQIS